MFSSLQQKMCSAGVKLRSAFQTAQLHFLLTCSEFTQCYSGYFATEQANKQNK